MNAPPHQRRALLTGATGYVGGWLLAELLRGGRYNGAMTYDDVLTIALAARGDDPFGYRSEFIQLVRAARSARLMSPTGE